MVMHSNSCHIALKTFDVNAKNINKEEKKGAVYQLKDQNLLHIFHCK